MTTPVPEALPTAYEYGRVIGRFLRAVGDGEDVDVVPEAVPATGTVTFTPIVTSRILIDASAEPSPLITHESITCDLDAYGHIARNGVRGVWLWTGEWTVSFNVSGMSRTPFPILLSTAHTDIAPLDLWEAAPYTPPAGATVTTMLVPTNPTDRYVLKWSAASSSLVWDSSSGGYPVQQVTLTGNLAYTLPSGAPADQVISVVFTQNTTGGNTVTYGGSPVTVDTTAGAQTEVELWPNGATTRTVVYPGAAGAGVDAEGVQDVVGAMVAAAGGSYNDAAGTITLPGGLGDTVTLGPVAPVSGWWIESPGPDTTGPTVPAGLSATATSDTTIALSWSASTDAEGVTGYEYAINAGAAVDAGAGTTETVSGLTAATLYSFTVRAYDAAGNRSAWSTASAATTQAAPDTTAPTWTATFTLGTPTSSSVVATASALASDNSGSVTYEVRYDNASTWAAIVPSGSNFTLSGAAGNTYATTKLRAKDAAGNYSTPVLSVPSYTLAGSADVTNHTVGTMAASAITSSGFTLTVSGAADETALHATPYAFTTDNGATWTAYQASAAYTASGMAASTGYSCNWRVRDAAGNVATGTAQTVTTGTGSPTQYHNAVLSLSPDWYLPFDDAPGASSPAVLGTYGSNFPITVNNAPTYGAASLGDGSAAANFATNKYIEVGSSTYPFHKPGGVSFSIGTFVQPNGLDISLWVGSPEVIVSAAGVVRVLGANLNTVFVAGTTYHLGLTWNSANSTMSAYINGALDKSWSSAPPGDTSSSTIGINMGAGKWANSILDGLFCVPATLSASDWANLYAKKGL